MATASPTSSRSGITALQALKALPTRQLDRALAWFGIANAVVGALRPKSASRSRRHLAKRWPASRSTGPDALAVTAGVAAVALIAYAMRKHYASRESEEEVLQVKASLSIQVEPRVLYDFFLNPERLMSVLEFAESVTVREPHKSRWSIRLSSGETMPVEIEIVDDAPGSLLAWRTTPQSAFPHHGVVALQAIDQGRGTLLQIEIEDDEMQGGQGWPPSLDSRLRKELRRLKQFLETGEVATTRGQPVGGRSVVGDTLTRGES